MTHVIAGTGSGGVGTSTTSIAGTFDLSSPGGAFDFEIFNANSPATVQAINLTTGDNTINTTNSPALLSAGGVLLIPPTGNGQALLLKKTGADTGMPLSPTVPTFIALPVAPPTSFVINAAGAVTGFQLGWI